MWVQILVLLTHIASAGLVVKSPAFAHGHYIPVTYTCEGENINPGLFVEGIPEKTRSFALILVDTSAAFGVFDHWILWNIPAHGKIEENSAPGITGANSRNETNYTGPCPPNGIHEYHFKMYALNTLLNLPAGSDKQALLKAMNGHILAQGELIGLFQK